MDGPEGVAQPATSTAVPYADWRVGTFSRGETLARPRAASIVAFEDLSERHFAFAIRDEFVSRCAPGQFAMLWVPGVDEVPMGISETDSEAGTAWFLVDRVGECTRAMGALRVGDRLGVRGPYGRPFDVPTDAHLLLVGGGTGTAPLLRTVHAAHAVGSTADVVLGARDAALLVWEDRFEAAADATYPCTNDGSHGFRGFTTDRMEALLDEGARYDAVLTCGPEPMMDKVVEIARARGLPAQVSVERYMKCGIGICGSCVMGEGVRACVEGPCIPATELEDVPDFGAFHRSADGSKHPL